MRALELVTLPVLMERSRGRQEVMIGLLDGPVATAHPDLCSQKIEAISGRTQEPMPAARGSYAGTGPSWQGSWWRGEVRRPPAICPNCTLLVRPMFNDAGAEAEGGYSPSATPVELADAVVECVDAGAQVLNSSAAVADSSIRHERELDDALEYAGKRRSSRLHAQAPRDTPPTRWARRAVPGHIESAARTRPRYEDPDSKSVGVDRRHLRKRG